MTESKSESADSESGKWKSYEYVGRTGSVIPTASSLAGTEVSVDEIRSAAAASSDYYPPSIHGALVSSPEPYPPGGLGVLVIYYFLFNFDKLLLSEFHAVKHKYQIIKHRVC